MLSRRLVELLLLLYSSFRTDCNKYIMGERANQSGNFSTRIEAAEFRKRFDEFSKFSCQKKEEISFGTKQERREITVACKRKEAYVSSTGRRAPLRWRKHDLNTLISLARRRERTNVVIHL